MLRFGFHGCGQRLIQLQPLWGSGGDQTGPGRTRDGERENVLKWCQSLSDCSGSWDEQWGSVSHEEAGLASLFYRSEIVPRQKNVVILPLHVPVLSEGAQSDLWAGTGRVCWFQCSAAAGKEVHLLLQLAGS